MDILALVDSMLAVGRMDRSKYHLTLGGAIEALSGVDGGTKVVFDDGSSPSDIDSYRGYYADLAIDSGSDECLASDFLNKLRAAVGDVFTGYKGGDYVMGEDTPLWHASYGCCGTAVVSYESLGDGVFTLITKDLD